MPSDQAPGWGTFTIDRPTRSRGVVHREERQTEHLDRPVIESVALHENLRDIRRVNRLAGGRSAVLRQLPALLRCIPPDRAVEVLDLATGSGDIPLAVAETLRRSGRAIALTVTDISSQILDEARRHLAEVPDVTFSLSDAREAPFPDGSFDIVLCSLALHHFSPPDAVRVLREMERLARVGFIVNDIRRCLPGYLAALLVSRIASRNALTRHDMPLSVRRAYTMREFRELLREAGIDDAMTTGHPLFRMVAVREKATR